MSATTLQLEFDVLLAQGGDRETFTRLVDATRNLVCSIVVAVVRRGPPGVATPPSLGAGRLSFLRSVGGFCRSLSISLLEPT